jgi:hypothetical protein
MPKGLKKLIKERIAFLEAIPDDFINQTVRGAESPLFDLVVSEFVDKLDTKDGKILNTIANLRLVAAIDKAWQKFQAKAGLEVVEQHLSNFEKIVNTNVEYYKHILEDNETFLNRAKGITSIINRRLGINPDGTLIKEGYLGGILEDVSVRNQLKEFSIKSVANGAGFEQFKKDFSTYIKGNDAKLGVLSKYYRNIAYDSYKQIDGLHNKLFGQKFGLIYFLYDGTIIKTTRKFCRRHCYKIFTVEEAQQWIKDPDLTAIPDNYDPLVDMGGFGCRHIPRFLTNDMAIDLEPGLKQLI